MPALTTELYAVLCTALGATLFQGCMTGSIPSRGFGFAAAPPADWSATLGRRWRTFRSATQTTMNRMRATQGAGPVRPAAGCVMLCGND